MQRVRDYLICFLSSLLLIYLQRFLAKFSYFSPSFPEGSYLSLALISGLLFGLISCPVCGLPLGLSLASTEKKVFSVFFKNIIFHLGRFLIIFSYGYLGGFLIQGLNKFFYNLGFILGGVLMVLIGGGILFQAKARVPFLFLRRGGLNPLFYLFFGLSLGFACGFEAIGFLVPLWLNENSLSRLIAGVVFSFSAILPTLLMSILIYLGFKGISSLFRERIRFFLVNTSGFFLLLLGVFFVVYFLR